MQSVEVVQDTASRFVSLPPGGFARGCSVQLDPFQPSIIAPPSSGLEPTAVQVFAEVHEIPVNDPTSKMSCFVHVVPFHISTAAKGPFNSFSPTTSQLVPAAMHIAAAGHDTAKRVLGTCV